MQTFNPLDYRYLREASFVLLAVFAAAERRLGAGKPSPDMSYVDLEAWIRAMDATRYGRLLDASPQPAHLLRTWTDKAVADGVVERVNGSQLPAQFMLTELGRVLAQLGPAR